MQQLWHTCVVMVRGVKNPPHTPPVLTAVDKISNSHTAAQHSILGFFALEKGNRNSDSHAQHAYLSFASRIPHSGMHPSQTP